MDKYLKYRAEIEKLADIISGHAQLADSVAKDIAEAV